VSGTSRLLFDVAVLSVAFDGIAFGVLFTFALIVLVVFFLGLAMIISFWLIVSD